jgi:putative SOS response-associated peptidase YedK
MRERDYPEFMCGRYYRRSDKQRIGDAFNISDLPSSLIISEAVYNVAPTTFQPVIRNGRETGERELVLMRWGLVPFFTKQLSDIKGISTINAKAENIQKSPTWRIPSQKRRCLVPADGFYEWARLDAKTKQPYAFRLTDDDPLAFAGLWDAWKEPDGGWLQSFSIVTTAANELMASVHTRMPVILHPRDYGRWLDGDAERPPIDMLRPFESELMAAAPCNPLVGNVRNNGPEMLNTA